MQCLHTDTAHVQEQWYVWKKIKISASEDTSTVFTYDVDREKMRAKNYYANCGAPQVSTLAER